MLLEMIESGALGVMSCDCDEACLCVGGGYCDCRQWKPIGPCNCLGPGKCGEAGPCPTDLWLPAP